MSRYLYFDLQAVAAQARHAVLADRNVPIRCGTAGENGSAEPALQLYRYGGQPRLAGNGVHCAYEALPPSVAADNSLTVPAVRLPHKDDAQALPLLDSARPSLMDLLTQGLLDGARWVMVDPNTLAVGVGRRRIRRRAPADPR
ncbi:hypothetical protein ACGFI9_31615 [Micromonospora sp. NPDC048930]|uniref:hypothetical protein n=1 Tax=Micromonospora sp. NPDC048930 TaxID=3364261 RepID=UPI00371783A6